MNTKKYNVLGMSCEGCQKKISSALNNVEGINADVNLAGNFVEISSEQETPRRLPEPLELRERPLQQPGLRREHGLQLHASSLLLRRPHPVCRYAKTHAERPG